MGNIFEFGVQGLNLIGLISWFGWLHFEQNIGHFNKSIMIMKLNKEWHLKNKMPKNAGFAERVKWHLAHTKNCSCRPIPEKLLEKMQKQGIKGPK